MSSQCGLTERYFYPRFRLDCHWTGFDDGGIKIRFQTFVFDEVETNTRVVQLHLLLMRKKPLCAEQSSPVLRDVLNVRRLVGTLLRHFGNEDQ